MSNFSPKLEDSDEKQLNHLINESSPNFGLLASNELTRRTLRKLDESTQRSNRTMILLTIAILFLTAILVGMGLE